MIAALRAGLGYFLGAFGLGFLLGTARVLLIEPSLGSLGAVLIELPVMLAATWFICGWLIRRFVVQPKVAERLAMGGLAFLLLQAAELALFLVVGDGGLSGFVAAQASAGGAAGLTGQVAFGLFPLVQISLERTRS